MSHRVQRSAWVAGLLVLTLMLIGCERPLAPQALVVVQTSFTNTLPPRDLLDLRYPPGTRLVLMETTNAPPRFLSREFVAVGEPIVRPDGSAVLFSGKRSADSPWQIFELKLPRGKVQQLTSLPDGASHAAILGNGDLVFSSPVPKLAGTWSDARPSALFVQHGIEAPEQITFGSTPAVQPTVLRDGRILFVSARVTTTNTATPRLGLFTVNNDGTEVTPFAVNDDGVPFIDSPRELDDGRIAFLAASNVRMSDAWLEVVRPARPFLSRTNLSFEEWLAAGGVAPPDLDLDWHNAAAARIAPRTKPAGHLSAMVPAKRTGTLLCLDSTFSRSTVTEKAARTRRVRVLAGANARSLGEVAIEPDGSFQVEVPADTPIGFEALDAAGRVTVRLAPTFWVRPGENRSCVGCHEAYNTAPSNYRPIAATKPPVKFPVMRPVSENDHRLSEAHRFPLAPALSLGEREQLIPSLDLPERFGAAMRLGAILPLPWGEGWGEGVQRADQIGPGYILGRSKKILVQRKP